MIRWYKLDNAAKLFPSVTGTRNTSVFRVSAVLKEEVDPLILQKALDEIYDRFPILTVRLRRGVFWNYLDPNHQKLIVQEECQYPCYPINAKENNGYLIKILYFGNRVSVELFHSLTDGSGAIEFLKSLLYYYLIFTGKQLSSDGKILLSNQCVSYAEIEDSFKAYYQNIKAKTRVMPRSYRIQGTYFKSFGNNVIHGVVSASELNKVSKKYGGTITAYLAAVLVNAIYQTRIRYDKSRKPVIISIPVNLRRVFPSITLRNFFGVVNVGEAIRTDNSFEELVLLLNDQLKEKITKENLLQIISNNVKLEQYKVARFAPLLLKHVFINIAFKMMGENKKTITLSNLGNIPLPEEMSHYVECMEAVLYPSSKSPINCGICSVNDKLVITFTRTIEENDIIRQFFEMLAEKDGLDITVYGNDWGREQDEM